jgi:CubicO group peptidase (beta-lactamase class C family)
VDKFSLPGLSIAISKDERRVLAKGFGETNIAKKTRVTPNNAFRIASVSKPITAITIMDLARRGLLRLDDYVFGNGCNPGPCQPPILGSTYSTQNLWFTNITVRHLLEHQSGLSNLWTFYSQSNLFLHGDPTVGSEHDPTYDYPGLNTDDLIAKIFKVYKVLIQFPPGTRFSYLNLGYLILGRVIERITGVSYFAYARNHMLVPNGITTMSIGQDDVALRMPNEATYYTSSNSEYNARKNFRRDSAGGWIARPIDLVALSTLADTLTPPPDKCVDILPPNDLTTMFTPSNPAILTYALGWNVTTDAAGSLTNMRHSGLRKGRLHT